MLKPILAGSLLALFVAVSPLEAGTVKISTIVETRVGHPDNPKESGPGGPQLTLQFSGDDLKDPSKFRLTVTEAVDDVGTRLILPRPPYVINDFNDVPPENINKDGTFFLNLALAHTPRRATKIAALKGSVTLFCGGTTTPVKAGNPLKIAGKKLDDPAFKQAGLEINALPVTPQPGATWVEFDITGATNALKKIEVVTADGKPAAGNPSWNFDRRSKALHYSYLVTAKMDDAMSVVITVIVGQKSVTVPLNMTDVPLP